MSKVLITGGAGYIGSMLSTELINLGHKVTVIDLMKYDKGSLEHLYFNKNFKLIKDDARKSTVLKKYVKKNDFVIPLAALVGAPLCEKNKIPYKCVDDINSKDNFDWIKSFKPDIIFCLGWSNLLKKNILTLAPMGVLGYHPSELPKNRVRHPLISALAL